jgi:hypothetical protein
VYLPTDYRDNRSDSLFATTTYTAQMSNALRPAEEAAVPKRQIKTGTQVKGWSQNAALVDACDKAKFQLSI